MSSTGKAASRKALQRWAADKKFVIASFYFWYAGTELQIREIHDVLVKSVPERFNPNEVPSHAFLAQIKTVPLRTDQLEKARPLSDLVDDMMYYAYEFEFQSKEADVFLLDELSQVYKSRIEALLAPVFFTTPSSIDPSLTEMRRSFVGFAMQRGLLLYVTEKLDQQLEEVLANTSLEYFIAKAIDPHVISKHRHEACLEFASLILRRGRVCGYKVEV